MIVITYPCQDCGCHIPWSLCLIGQQLQARESDVQIAVECARRENDVSRLAGALAELAMATAAYNHHVGIRADEVNMVNLAWERCPRDVWHNIIRADVIRLCIKAGEPVPSALREVQT
jgi:hypothetical protein